MSNITKAVGNYETIRAGIIDLLRTARSMAARNVNSLMTAAYWEIGRRIVQFEQRGEVRANYGEQLIEQLAADLSQQFGRGFGRANLRQMRAFYLAWPQSKIRQTVSGESSTAIFSNAIEAVSSRIGALAAGFPLPWSAYVRLLALKKPEARAFYEAEALRSGWTVRQLDRQIQSQFYERTALSKNKAAMLEKAAHPDPGDAMTPEEAIKDPFVLEFLDLKDEYSESELEEALVSHLADYQAQLGGKHALSKPLRGIAPGVLEVVSDHRGDTFRAVYAVRLAGRVYVLHAFQKKSKSGIATPQPEINLIKQRLKRAIEMHEAWEKQHG